MNGSHEALAEFQRAYDRVRQSLAAALEEAGFELVAATPKDGGAEWEVRIAARAAGPRAVVRPTAERPVLRIAEPAPEPEEEELPYYVSTETPIPARAPHPDPEDVTPRVPAVTRAAGESFAQLLGKDDDRLDVAFSSGNGGIQVSELAEEERIRLVATTLVGDAFLDMQHRQVDQGDELAVAEVRKQLELFREESKRVLGAADVAPFIAALDEWAPADFPRGTEFLQRVS